MTRSDIAEIEQLLAAYRVACVAGTMLNIARSRRRLETVLVRHADQLLEAAKARDWCCDTQSSAEWERAQLRKRDYTP